MKLRTCGLFAIAAFVSCFLGNARTLAQNAYITNSGDNTVSVIATASNTVTATIPVGNRPLAFGVFIQPLPKFAGMPGKANCHGQSVSALAQQYGGLSAAAAALGYSSVQVLQNAIAEYCAV